MQSVTGEFSLYLPADWLDLLADGPGPEADDAARGRFFDLAAATYPRADRMIIEATVDGLMAWRSVVLSRGVVSHGVVSCPFPADTDAEAPLAPEPGADSKSRASWHVLTAILRVPRLSPDCDLGELLARMVGAQLDPGGSYIEAFTTDMGCGVGLLLQPTIPAETGAATSAWDQVASTLAENGVTTTTQTSRRYGLAAALAFPAGGGPGLLVTGICMDPTQLLELAGLVAVIAGRSKVWPVAADSEAR